jgi:hypothetical protein
MAATRNPKPKFGSAVTWGACSRCNARVKYSTLCRERLTGLLVCGPASGRPVRYCLDPWPPVYDFQAFPDKSIEPPAEPLPLRYNLDAIWGNGPVSGNTSDFANAPAAAPDDATRLNNLLRMVPYYAAAGKTAAFTPRTQGIDVEVAKVLFINPANYDGTFLPSSSVRTVTPPIESPSSVTQTDKDVPSDQLWTPPWAVNQGV